MELTFPYALEEGMRKYLWIIFWGIGAVFLYNYFASLLRAVGNSAVPLYFLGVSAITNILLDILFVPVFGWGIEGAAVATVLAQILSGEGERKRIRRGIKSAMLCVFAFGILTSGIVCIFARELLLLFLKQQETQALAYSLSAITEIGVMGIWVSVPIGWFLADVVGIAIGYKDRERLLGKS